MTQLFTIFGTMPGFAMCLFQHALDLLVTLIEAISVNKVIFPKSHRVWSEFFPAFLLVCY